MRKSPRGDFGVWLTTHRRSYTNPSREEGLPHILAPGAPLDVESNATYLEGPCHPLTQPEPASGGQQGPDTDLQLPNPCQAHML